MTADAHLFFLLLLAAAIVYGFAPIIGAAFVILACLALFAWSPILALGLGLLWLFRWFVVDFFLALIGGYGLGLGLRASGRPRRFRRQWWR
jgi:hypothetical protein